MRAVPFWSSAFQSFTLLVLPPACASHNQVDHGLSHAMEGEHQHIAPEKSQGHLQCCES